MRHHVPLVLVILAVMLVSCAGSANKFGEDEALKAAMLSDDRAGMEALLNSGMDANRVYSRSDVADDRRLIHIAATSSNPEMVDLLIRHGAAIDAQDHLGRTPLMSAASLGRVEMVDCLLRQRASVNRQDPKGRTPMHHALRLWVEWKQKFEQDKNASEYNMWAKRYEGIVGALLSHGGDPKLKDAQGESPLDIAKANGFAKVAAMMENGGAR